MSERRLYTYLPKDNSAELEGILSTAQAPMGWEKYIKRSGKATREDVLRWLDALDPGFKRSNAISVFSEPIPDNADRRMVEFAKAKILYSMPSVKELLKLRLINAIRSINTGRRGTHPVTDTGTRHIQWDKKKPGKFLFSNVPHYLIETANGNIPPEYITKEASDSKLEDARVFVALVKALAAKRGLNVFVVTDGASGVSNNGNPAVKNAREAKIAQIACERNNGFDPEEDWGR